MVLLMRLHVKVSENGPNDHGHGPVRCLAVSITRTHTHTHTHTHMRPTLPRLRRLAAYPAFCQVTKKWAGHDWGKATGGGQRRESCALGEVFLLLFFFVA